MAHIFIGNRVGVSRHPRRHPRRNPRIRRQPTARKGGAGVVGVVAVGQGKVAFPTLPAPPLAVAKGRRAALKITHPGARVGVGVEVGVEAGVVAVGAKIRADPVVVATIDAATVMTSAGRV